MSAPRTLVEAGISGPLPSTASKGGTTMVPPSSDPRLNLGSRLNPDPEDSPNMGRTPISSSSKPASAVPRVTAPRTPAGGPPRRPARRRRFLLRVRADAGPEALADAVEALLARMDALDGEPDREPALGWSTVEAGTGQHVMVGTDDGEPEHDGYCEAGDDDPTPSGLPYAHDRNLGTPEDGEPHDEGEPSLGWNATHRQHPHHLAAGMDPLDREDEPGERELSIQAAEGVEPRLAGHIGKPARCGGRAAT